MDDLNLESVGEVKQEFTPVEKGVVHKDGFLKLHDL